MAPTAAFCRTQESQHRDRAAAATLANVRQLAVVAADAWAKEAILADRRQLRQDSKAADDAVIEDEVFLPNENPDRGMATAGDSRLAGVD